MYATRREAGRQLAAEVAGLHLDAPVVVGIPRGGIVVAAEVARPWGGAVAVVAARKLPSPWQPHLGMGAVAEGGVRLVNRDVIERYGVEPHDLAYATQRARQGLEEAIQRYRNGAPRPSVAGRDVGVVDDGRVTGFTARAAAAAVRAAGARRIVVAVPVATAEAAAAVSRTVEGLVVCSRMAWLDSVQSAYAAQDELDVRALRRLVLRRSLRAVPAVPERA